MTIMGCPGLSQVNISGVYYKTAQLAPIKEWRNGISLDSFCLIIGYFMAGVRSFDKRKLLQDRL
eukprot:snap_masked-scaffold_3-processed-gene-12.31-mRNA-1 protein AED:1.00 eAED:1.00 QI:0/0/0/0/1/1/2/0/63